MRYTAVALIMFFWMNSTQGQIIEVGPYIGGSNFIGDVGSTNYIDPNSIAFGGIVKWNRSPRHSWRVSLIHTTLTAKDSKSNQGRRRQRGYSLSNGLTELTIGMEYTFWEWNLFKHIPQIVPYLATGISGIHYHNYYLGNDHQLEKKDDVFGLALPMIFGIKGTLGRGFVLAVEVGARMAFTDNLDGSTPSEFDGGAAYPSFGNQNTNDWYMFSGITLTYTFGHKHCYDKF